MSDQYLKEDYLLGCDENMVFCKYKYIYEKLARIVGETHIPSQIVSIYMKRAKELEKMYTH